MRSHATNRRRKPRLSSAAGLSLLELLVVVALIFLASSFAVVNFARSNRTFKVGEATRTLSGYLEKARVDSVRRHGGATININSTSSYNVNVDFAGTGITTSRTIILPSNITLRYSLPPSTTSLNPSDSPITVAYNWRGQTASTILLTLTDSASGVSSSVVVGSAGDVSANSSVTGPVTTPTPVNTTVTTTTGIRSMN